MRRMEWTLVENQYGKRDIWEVKNYKVFKRKMLDGKCFM
jgi:hypothetical protein